MRDSRTTDLKGGDVVSHNVSFAAAFLSIHSDIKQTKHYKQQGQTSVEDMQSLLSDSNKVFKEKEELYKNDRQKTKALAKYKIVLDKIKNLLDIVITDTDDLSLEKLILNIDNHMKSRQFITDQINFTYYQNMYTQAINELLEIEQAFQNNEINEFEAVQLTYKIEDKIYDNGSYVPSILEGTHAQIKTMITAYINNYEKIGDVEDECKQINIRDSGIRVETAEMFALLNMSSRKMLEDLGDLNRNLSSFQPAVDLDGLKKSLIGTNDLLKEKDFNVDNFSSKVILLGDMTNNLTYDQEQKNKDHESYAKKIKEIEDTSTKITTYSLRKTLEETVESVNDRTDGVENTTDKLLEMADGNNATPQNVIEEMSKVLEEQLDADAAQIDQIETSEVLYKNPAALDALRNCSSLRVGDAKDNLDKFNQKIQDLLNTQTLKYKQDDEEDK